MYVFLLPWSVSEDERGKQGDGGLEKDLNIILIVYPKSTGEPLKAFKQPSEEIKVEMDRNSRVGRVFIMGIPREGKTNATQRM